MTAAPSVRRRIARLLLLLAGLAPGLLPPTADAQKGATSETVQPNRDILDCPIKQRPTRNGPPPRPETIGLVIRCLHERPPVSGGDGAVTVDIEELEVGPPRGWDRTRDVGSGGSRTQVYPVRTIWTERIFLRGQTVVRLHESVFDCYVSGLGEWACAHGRHIREPQVTHIPVK